MALVPSCGTSKPPVVDEWDESPSWLWRSRRLLERYDVSANLPDSPRGFSRMPEGTLMGLTAWPADFTLDDWRDLTRAITTLAKQLA